LPDTARSVGSLIPEILGRGPVVAEFLTRSREQAAAARGGWRPCRSIDAATRYNNTKFFWSHARRADWCGQPRVGAVDAESLAATPAVDCRLYHVRRFYDDAAASANPLAIQGLETLLRGTSHIVFGTDVPLRDLCVGPTGIANGGILRHNSWNRALQCLAILPRHRSR
jgi:hypothetical protein